MMNFDNQTLPFQVSQYRQMQRVIPAATTLYELSRIILETNLQQNDRLLIVGAGGGREVEHFATSPKAFSLLGIDPSAEMLEIAKAYVEHYRVEKLCTLVKGTLETLDPTLEFDAATSLLVMHFLKDDGEKLNFLKAIRQRLKPGAVYLHADLCFTDTAEFQRVSPVFVANAKAAGIPYERAIQGPALIETLPVISEERTRELFTEAGFGSITPYYRGLWYSAWWCVAV